MDHDSVGVQEALPNENTRVNKRNNWEDKSFVSAIAPANPYLYQISKLSLVDCNWKIK